MSIPNGEWRYFVGCELNTDCFSVFTRVFVLEFAELLKKKTFKASQLTLNVAE